METNWDLLIENHFNKKEALAMDMLVEMVEQAMDENMGKSGEGTDLEKAVVAAWNKADYDKLSDEDKKKFKKKDIPKGPKHFEGFAPLSAADLLDRYKLSGTARMPKKADPVEDWTGKNRTSKADIIIGDKNISMKMGPKAMLFGFGEGDATATLNAALGEVIGQEELTEELEELRNALADMKTTFVRGPKGALEKVVKNLKDLPTDTDTADKALRHTQLGTRYKYPEQDVLDQARKGIKTGDKKLEDLAAIKTLDALKEHVEGDLKEVNDSLKRVEEAAKKAFDMEDNKNLKYAFYKYALTGQKKFKKGAEQIANSMLVTQEKPDLKKYTGKKRIDQLQVFYPEINDELIQKIANSASFRGKVRSDSVKVSEQKTGFYKLRESIVAEIKQIEDEANEFLKQYEDLLNDDKLNEGVVDFFKDIFGKMISWLTKSYDSLNEKLEELKDAAAKAVDKGVDGLMDFFGINKEKLLNDKEADLEMGEVFPELFIKNSP
jgi:hypothetical protein